MTMQTPTRVAHDTVQRVAAIDAERLSGGDAVSIARSAIVADRKQIRELGLLGQFVKAYEAFDGDDVGQFTHDWEDYLSGLDEPCPQTADGLHQVTHGSCDQCGSKNRS